MSENHRTLLMDGDTIAYIAAAAVQGTMEDTQGFVQPFAKREEGEACVDSLIQGLYRDLSATGLQVYLSDPESNWRDEIAKGYKGGRNVDDGLGGGKRNEVIRPLLLGRLKEYLRGKYGATHWPGLEADDVLGILMTCPPEFPGERIMVGRDKDFDTIPGLHCQIGRDLDSRGRPTIREVSPTYADWWHMVQAFAGDRVDGYPGCPGIGMERAKQILAEPFELVPEEGVITRGVRKGQTTTKWVKRAPATMWRCVVSHYAKAYGGDWEKAEAEALLNARLARILRAYDYNRDTGAVRLWVP